MEIVGYNSRKIYGVIQNITNEQSRKEKKHCGYYFRGITKGDDKYKKQKASECYHIF